MTSNSGTSTTTATYSTANHNSQYGWITPATTSTLILVTLENCIGSENGLDGLIANNSNASSVTSVSNCVFSNNGAYGIHNEGTGPVQSRGNNTVTGNGAGATFAAIATFAPI